MKTTNENARNDKYAIMKKGETDARVISYRENFINYIMNDLKLFDHEFLDRALKNDATFRQLITELDNKDYYVYQLTRL